MNDPVINIVLLVFVSGAAVYDLASRKIPNRLVLCGLTCALTLHLLSGRTDAVLSVGLAGGAAGLLLFLPLYLVRGMAAGDVKLMAMVGAFAGPGAVIDIGAATVVIGALMGVAIAVGTGQLSALMASTGNILRQAALRTAGAPLQLHAPRTSCVGGMPYGVAIALATLLTVWLRMN